MHKSTPDKECASAQLEQEMEEPEPAAALSDKAPLTWAYIDWPPAAGKKRGMLFLANSRARAAASIRERSSPGQNQPPTRHPHSALGAWVRRRCAARHSTR